MVVEHDAVVCDEVGLQQLVDALRADDRRVYGPVVRDGAIVLRPIESVTELPVGWTQKADPGEVRLARRDDDLRFGRPVEVVPSTQPLTEQTGVVGRSDVVCRNAPSEHHARDHDNRSHSVAPAAIQS